MCVAKGIQTKIGVDMERETPDMTSRLDGSMDDWILHSAYKKARTCVDVEKDNCDRNFLGEFVELARMAGHVVIINTAARHLKKSGAIPV